MFTDMVGYTALGQRNESLSLALVEEQRKLIRPILSRHNGREIKTMGDAFLVEFPSALEALRCAYEIQRATREFNVPLPVEKRIHLRVGLHLGDVVESLGDISGDAVNVASRIEALAEDGGVVLTRQVHDHVTNKLELQMTSLGQKSLKNVRAPVEVFKVVLPWEQSSTWEGETYPRNRIAILPFASFSLDPSDGFFADGITDEVISTVSGISGLNVISRTSVVGYKGTTKRVKEIGKELEVGSILEGSFKKAGNKIRVTTQLIDVAGDRHLWAQSYDRDLDDVFAVQSDIAKQVADALRVKILSPEMKRIEKKPTESTTAYTYYLKGRYLWNKRGMEDLKQALEYFEKSVKEDPGFALGYVGVADSRLILHTNWGLDGDANLENARIMVAKALELDPTLAEAHATKGLVLESEYDLKQAEEEYRKAIELKPSYATAHLWYSQVLISQLRWDEAREQIEKALELDPLSPIINQNYGHYFYYMRDYRKALEFYKRAAELGMVVVRGFLSLAFGRLKMFDEMRRVRAIAAEASKETFPLRKLGDEAVFAWMEDDREKLRRLLPEVEAHLRETGWNLYFLAAQYFHLGDKDKGFELLEKSYSEKEVFLIYVRSDDSFDNVRDDPRYFALLRKLGLG
jgi:TolB-like protein